MNAIIKILFGIGLILVGQRIDIALKPELVGGGIILIASVLFIDGAIFILKNYQRLRLLLHSKWLALFRKYIRFSMSYQYIIKAGDKYLLVKNANKGWDWYQHVGGKYKRLEETQYVLRRLGARDDLKMTTDGLKKGDLAVFIPAKNAIKFLDWFETGKDRELSHWREFYEELIGGKTKKRILSSENFPYVNYRFLKSLRTPLKRAPIETGWNCWEILHYDVLELIPTEAQVTELKELQSKGDTEYIKWVSEACINNLGYDETNLQSPYKIAPHSKWVINLKWSRV